MSRKSALSWYLRNKGSEALKERIRKQQASFEGDRPSMQAISFARRSVTVGHLNAVYLLISLIG
jgi:hypothetical protein